jgi:phage shock protein PspC (stress-responsive transcriptional regulator)
VVGGLAERLEVEPFTARLVAIVLALAGGFGVIAYVVAWALSTAPDQAAEPPAASPRRTLAAVSISLGLLVGLRRLGLWPGDGVMLPALVVATGAGLSGWRHGRPDPDRGRRLATSTVGALFSGRVSLRRLAIGGALIMLGAWALAGSPSLDALGRAFQSILLALLGATIVLGPWLGRLVEQLGTERRQRIRSEERAAVAAHLHDSVLQTLALIQRNPSDTARVVRLARRQERDLRAWLYGDQSLGVEPETLAVAAEQLARDVESDHDVRLDLVVVGDHPLDEPARTLLGAVREASVNAAKHAGVDVVAVYIEAEVHQLTAFVRDRGRGFQPDLVPRDRRGIAESIRGRIERAGGHTVVTSAPGEGAEVQVTVPLLAAAS